MTPTNDQIVAEAQRRRDAVDAEQRWPLEEYVIDVVREGWTPPEPVVDPDLLAFREWSAAQGLDPGPDVLLRDTYLAGARMAREQERERAKVLLHGLEDIVVDADQDVISQMALDAMVKYRKAL